MYHAMNDRAVDSVPLAVRGFLFVLVVCLHVAGASAFSSGLPQQYSEEPAVLRARWIEVSPSLSPPTASMQVAEPLPAPRPPPPPRRSARVPERQTRSEVSAPPQLQTAAVQPAPAPAVVDTPPAVPTEPLALGDPDSRIDASTAVAAAATSETVGGEGENRGEEGGLSRDYVGPDFNVSYFSNPEPDYPSLSRRLREQGLVKLRVHVTVDGRAGEVTLHKSSGFERLDRAALDAVRRWRFRPAQQAGKPVAGWVLVPVRFELHG